MTRIHIRKTPIAGMVEARTKTRSDNRGIFQRLFCIEELYSIHKGRPIAQINQSITLKRGALRGMHFQHPPYAEAKWIRCLAGKVFDVGVDLRRGSKTFLKWHGVELDAEQANAVFLPEGFAHGFQVLEPGSALLYLHTAVYAPGYEGGIRHDDPKLAIDWPLEITDISQRDESHPLLDDSFEGLAC